MLANISYRNHFQDLYSNSSFLKSIGSKEERVSIAKTPGLGPEEYITASERSGGVKGSARGHDLDSVTQAPFVPMS